MMAEENKKRAICIFLYYIILFLLGVGWITIGSIILDKLVLDSDVKKILNIIRIFSLGLGDDIEILSGTIIAIGCVTVLYAATEFVLRCYNVWKSLHEGVKKKEQLSLWKIILICFFFGILIPSTLIVLGLWSHINKEIRKDVSRGYLEENIKKSFTEEADVVSNLDSFPNSWNKIFMKLDCCAVNNVESTTNDFDNTPWCTTSGECQQTNSQIPKTCCNDVTVSTYTSAPTTCHANVDSGTYNTKGCNDVLGSLIDCYSSAVIGVGVVLFIFLAVAVCLAFKRDFCDATDAKVSISDKEQCEVSKTTGHAHRSDSFRSFETQNERAVVAFHDPSDVLSNSFEADIKLENETHKTAEHAFQFHKALYFKNEQAADRIRNAHSASIAYKIGNKLGTNSKWEKEKEKVMLKILQAKFNQVEPFRQKVKKCDPNSILVLTISDDYRGSGLDEDEMLNTKHNEWPGRNRLGVLIKSLIPHESSIQAP